MSRVTLREPGLLVVEEVLRPDVFRALLRDIAGGEYRGVHSQHWDRAWRLSDGDPLRGGSVYYDPGAEFDWQGPRFPTSTPVDPLIEAVRATVAACPDICGREGLDWIALYLSSWLYPVGSALSLHLDGDKYSGAFTFFAHQRWCAHWGGELLVLPVSQHRFDRPGDWIADDTDLGDDPGIAICVVPKPNRLVLLGPNRPHRIARVDRNAGAHLRASVAGFFLRPPF